MTQYDLNSAEFLANPYPVYDQLRRNDPIYWSAENNYWILTRYADIASLVQHDDLSRTGSLLTPVGCLLKQRHTSARFSQPFPHGC